MILKYFLFKNKGYISIFEQNLGLNFFGATLFVSLKLILIVNNAQLKIFLLLIQIDLLEFFKEPELFNIRSPKEYIFYFLN